MQTLLNPSILIEMTSDSTERNGASWKLGAYTRIESLREYWIVGQEDAVVTRIIRQGDLWRIDVTRGLDAVLEGDGYRIPLRRIYHD